MTTLTASRKQRLRKLENEIRSGMEEFYYVGMKLKEIRDDRLYEEDGFESFDRYCRERFEYAKSYVYNLISSAEYRAKLPSCSTGGQEWSERSVRELKRIPDKRQAARVAKKVITQIAKEPEAKRTSTLVRKFVDADLGVKKAKPKLKPQAGGVDLVDYIDRKTGTIEGVCIVLQAVPKDGWKLLKEDNPQLVERLITACASLAAFLRKVRDDRREEP